MTDFFRFLILALLLSGAAIAHAETSLIAPDSEWSYLDSGNAPEGDWKAADFDDSGWKSGKATLGYGDAVETEISYGGDDDNKHIAYYFRRSFTAENVDEAKLLMVRLLVDDGAVVYLNGTEIARRNMPQGRVSARTTANNAVGGGTESTFFDIEASPDALKSGENIVAVEVHQANDSSSDLGFNLELLALDELPAEDELLRGPYLQSGSPDAVTILWRTSGYTPGLVAYGTDPENLKHEKRGPLATDHEIRLTGLKPSTTYYYAIGTDERFTAGPAPGQSFKTHPEIGKEEDTRIWVVGDSGTANANARAVRDTYKNFTGDRRADAWLMLGDNAYNSGTDEEFQRAVFEMYPELLRSTMMYSTRGNHARDTDVYYSIHSNPTNAECGGTRSGSEAFYSFDIGSIHFICLDSFGTDRGTDGAMYRWLEADLQNTAQKWIIAFFHHPPYTKGSHNSDNRGDSGGRMHDMRERFLPLLEAGGVDMVLAGHSHVYERSYLINGHYGQSDSFEDSMIIQGGDGRPESDGAYTRPHENDANKGTVYIVAGSSGKATGNGPLDHPAMFISLKKLASVVLDVEGDTLSATTLGHDGAVLDTFAMEKE